MRPVCEKRFIYFTCFSAHALGQTLCGHRPWLAGRCPFGGPGLARRSGIALLPLSLLTKIPPLLGRPGEEEQALQSCKSAFLVGFGSRLRGTTKAALLGLGTETNAAGDVKAVSCQTPETSHREGLPSGAGQRVASPSVAGLWAPAWGP